MRATSGCRAVPVGTACPATALSRRSLGEDGSCIVLGAKLDLAAHHVTAELPRRRMHPPTAAAIKIGFAELSAKPLLFYSNMVVGSAVEVVHGAEELFAQQIACHFMGEGQL